MKMFLLISMTLLVVAPVIFAAIGPIEVPRERPAEGRQTNNAALQLYLQDTYPNELAGEAGHWTLTLVNREIFIITDENADRMRIMTLAAEAEGLKPEQLQLLLEANFDRALDARYAIWKDAVWAVYIHPLSEVGREQFLDGIRQTVMLAQNYGTTYSSTNLVFGGDGE